MHPAPPNGLSRPISAGVVSALVGFTSSFVIVLSGLAGVGADAGQAASGLLTVSVTMGLSSALLALWTRMPITVAWSTPGAALLASTGVVDGGWPAAVGAFLVTGVLFVVTGLVPWLGALIARIPTSVAQAMLAGVLLQLCLGPVTGLADNPLAVAPVVAVWLLALRFLPRWAAPLAFLTAAVVIGVDLAVSGTSIDPADLVPHLELTAPAFTLGGIVGIAVPLYLVTMASQNVAGAAVMKSLGYEVPWRRSMVVTGIGTVIGAPTGGHAINLAAISAALAAGPEADADPGRRYLAARTAGSAYVGFALVSVAVAALVATAPAGFVAAAAGLALWPVLGSSLSGALARPEDRIPVVATFLVAISGITVGGIGSAFWSLVVGMAFWAWSRPRPAEVTGAA